MENILHSLEIDWIKLEGPCEEIVASLIYITNYICFTLVKINSDEYSGDVYRLNFPNPMLTFEMRMLLNKLACAGLKFMFRSNELYPVNPAETEHRIYGELHPTFEVIEELNNPVSLNDAMFDMIEETFNNYRDTSGRYFINDNILELASYFRYFHTIPPTSFSIGDRWANIGKILLRIAIDRREETIAALIIYCLNIALMRVGDTADISLLSAIKEFSTQPTGNKLLERWNNKILSTIDSHNRIFYEI